MRLRKVLDDIFDRGSKVKVLRVLTSPGIELTGREIAAEAQINHAGCTRTLQHLVDLGVVELRKKGRSHLYSLRRRNVVVEQGILPLFRLERGLLEAAMDYLRDKIKSRVISAVLFGSYARGAETPGSDLDIFLMVSDERQEAQLADEVEAFATDFSERFGISINPYIKRARTAERMLRTNKPPMGEILKEGVDFFGDPLRKALSHGPNKARAT